MLCFSVVWATPKCGNPVIACSPGCSNVSEPVSKSQFSFAFASITLPRCAFSMPRSSNRIHYFFADCLLLDSGLALSFRVFFNQQWGYVQMVFLWLCPGWSNDMTDLMAKPLSSFPFAPGSPPKCAFSQKKSRGSLLPPRKVPMSVFLVPLS